MKRSRSYSRKKPREHLLCWNNFGNNRLYVKRIENNFNYWASLSKPNTSESSGTSVMFTKIYEVIRINGHVCKWLRLKTDKTRLLTNASGHYTKNYNVSLQALHIRLVHTFITQRNITLVYRRSI